MNDFSPGTQLVIPSFHAVPDLDSLFVGSGSKVKIDERFRAFFKPLDQGISFATLFCRVVGTNGIDADIRALYGIRLQLMPCMAYSMLQYLHNGGARLLDIPKGEEEVNIILGYAGDIVYYVEREMEDGEDEIHLHARPARDWGDDRPMAFVFS